MGRGGSRVGLSRMKQDGVSSNALQLLATLELFTKAGIQMRLALLQVAVAWEEGEMQINYSSGSEHCLGSEGSPSASLPLSLILEGKEDSSRNTLSVSLGAEGGGEGD